jgi:carbon monoxide dehydrogenase subunit G
MGIPIEKSFVVRAPASAVWAFLTDPRRVASCLPGAAITEQVDDKTYGGTIAVRVGPVLANYRGKMHFERLDAAAYEAEIAATGQETRGKGGADMRMKSRIVERSPGESEVTVTSDVNVVGVLAQFGRGMIQDVSDILFQKFTDGMRRQLEGDQPGAAATAERPAAAPAGDGAAGATAATAATATNAAAPAATAAVASAAAAPAATAAVTSAAATGAGATPATAAVTPLPVAVTPASSPSPAAAAAPAATPDPAPPRPVPPRPAPMAAPPPAHEDVLDVGALGATAARRAAARTLQRPAFWIALAVAAAILCWWLLR